MDTPPLRIVDTITDRPFGGDPAGVVVLERRSSTDWTAGLGDPATALVIPDEPRGHLTAAAARDLTEQAG